jgi:hypothetical protein
VLGNRTHARSLAAYIDACYVCAYFAPAYQARARVDHVITTVLLETASTGLSMRKYWITVAILVIDQTWSMSNQ